MKRLIIIFALLQTLTIIDPNSGSVNFYGVTQSPDGQSTVIDLNNPNRGPYIFTPAPSTPGVQSGTIMDLDTGGMQIYSMPDGD